MKSYAVVLETQVYQKAIKYLQNVQVGMMNAAKKNREESKDDKKEPKEESKEEKPIEND